ncbi:hypothetical protein [Kitasatospora sp. NPDC093558]|uniref:hypothetical protein n=1 Tax=Kitasatospora sp. NPDC093558 TaxID=3155201 RepID=UPI003448FFBA
MSGCIARKIAAFGAATVAALGILGTTALPAAAEPAADRTITAGPNAATDAITASYHCVITADYGWRWEGKCNIYSGELRTITYCANGTSSTGLWIGARPEAWDVWGNCPNSTWTRVLFQTRG